MEESMLLLLLISALFQFSKKYTILKFFLKQKLVDNGEI